MCGTFSCAGGHTPIRWVAGRHIEKPGQPTSWGEKPSIFIYRCSLTKNIKKLSLTPSSTAHNFLNLTWEVSIHFPRLVSTERHVFVCWKLGSNLFFCFCVTLHEEKDKYFLHFQSQVLKLEEGQKGKMSLKFLVGKRLFIDLRVVFKF